MAPPTVFQNKTPVNFQRAIVVLTDRQKALVAIDAEKGKMDKVARYSLGSLCVGGGGLIAACFLPAVLPVAIVSGVALTVSAAAFKIADMKRNKLARQELALRKEEEAEKKQKTAEIRQAAINAVQSALNLGLLESNILLPLEGQNGMVARVFCVIPTQPAERAGKHVFVVKVLANLFESAEKVGPRMVYGPAVKLLPRVQLDFEVSQDMPQRPTQDASSVQAPNP